MNHCRYATGFVCLAGALSCPAADAPKADEPRRISFKAEADGTTQSYVEMLPRDHKPGETLHLMVALHGAGGDGSEYFKHPAPQCRATRDLAGKHRLILVGPDYRGPGSWMGPKADEDVAQIIRDVKARYKVGKVFVVGASMGGTAALTFTVLHPELVDGVVSQCGFANLLGPSPHLAAMAKSFGGTPEQQPAEFKKRSAELWPDKITMPIAIWTGGKDGSVPPQSAIRLAKVLKSKNPDRVLHVHSENSGHTPNYEDTIKVYEFVLGAVLKPSK